jgi:lipopolysaccharide export system permease protein
LRPRQGRYGKMGLAILIYFIYVNLLAASRVWIERGTTPADAGMWWVHAIFIAIGVWLLLRHGVFGRRVAQVAEPA